MGQKNNLNAKRDPVSSPIAGILQNSPRSSVTLRAERGVFPLSSVQKRLWFMEQYHPDTAVNHIRSCYRLSGNLDIAALDTAFTGILNRHEVLRSRYQNGEGQPVQSIAPECAFQLHLIDLSQRPEEVREQEAIDIAADEAARPFDLEAGGLLRGILFRLSPEEHLLALTLHHIVFDGWSLDLLFRELSAGYSAALKGAAPAHSPTPAIQYADFAAWQEQWLAEESVAAQAAYWSNHLAGAATRVDLPEDFPRPIVQSFRGGQESIRIPASTALSLGALARQQDATLFMVLYAAYRLLLSRHAGEADILVGTPVAGRTRWQLEPLIGCFVNTLVLRTPVDENQTFTEFLRTVKEEVLGALSNQDVPFEKVVEQAQPERDDSRAPLVQVYFALQSVLPRDLEMEGLHTIPVALPVRTARYDLNLDVFPTECGLLCAFEYAADLFLPEAMRDMASHYLLLVQSIVARPWAKLSQLQMLSTSERMRMVLEWNNTAAAYPEYTCLHELIQAQVARTPDAIAVQFRDKSLTYAELDERSNKLANHLRRLGVKVESPVGVCLDRSMEMVVAVLGVMKAGGAYVPLDPGFPAARLQYMLSDSGAAILITADDQEWRFGSWKGTVLRLGHSARAIAAESAELKPSGVRSENLVYIIYTSGSTGKPKGVMIPHCAVVNFLHSMREQPGITGEDSLLAVTTLSFDIAALEIYLPLISGARTIIGDSETVLDGRRLAAEIEARRPTIMQATPSTWTMLIESGWRGSRRLKALCGGESISVELADALLERTGSLWNMYGPTETTVWSTIFKVEGSTAGRIAIGRPILNTTVYVLDSWGRAVPRGTPGTLYIGGKGVARGYRNLPVLTEQAFIPNPLPECAGERIYNTGDLARYNSAGQLECLGRLDGQVKIRGHRVELGEIESALRRYSGIRDAVVGTSGSDAGDQRLVAWLIAAEAAPADTSEIQRYAESILPGYMVPSAFVFLDGFPMTPNGKINRQALPAPAPFARAASDAPEPPRTKFESKLLRIFEELLDVKPLSVTESFFDAGGHSLLATRLVIRIEKEIGPTIPVATLFRAPSVRQLAQALEDHSYAAAWSPLVELRKGSAGVAPLFCIHWLDAKLVTFQEIISTLPYDRPVYGLQPDRLPGHEHPPETIAELASVYKREIRARHPHGPYHLTGSCLGGVVAFEIAQQLIAEGEKIGLLLLIDAYMPGRLQYLHERSSFVWYPDWYFGEFLLSPAAALKRWIQEGILRLTGKEHGNDFATRTTARLRKVSLAACAHYNPQAYPGKITLLICSDSPSRTYEDRRLAWSSVAEGGLEVHVLPGNHTTMEQEPNLQILAAEFQRCFEMLEPGPRSYTPRDEREPSAAENNRPCRTAPEKSGGWLLPGTCV